MSMHLMWLQQAAIYCEGLYREHKVYVTIQLLPAGLLITGQRDIDKTNAVQARVTLPWDQIASEQTNPLLHIVESFVIRLQAIGSDESSPTRPAKPALALRDELPRYPKQPKLM